MWEKRGIAGFLSVILLAGGLLGGCGKKITPSAASVGSELRIMSFNVAGFSGNLFKGTRWSGRAERFAELLAKKMPDSVGTQEMANKWLVKLQKLLPQYAAVGVARDDGKEEGEYNTIFYLKEKYELTDFGTFWLSKTPDKPSKYDKDTGCNRICTYAVLKNRQTGRSYAHVNTHFDNVSAEAREYGARQVRQKAESYLHLPVVITGDFNCSPRESPYQILAAAPFADTQKTARSTMEPGSYHDWGGISPAEGLDYCLITPDTLTAQSYQVLREDEVYQTLSDHYALYVTLQFLDA